MRLPPQCYEGKIKLPNSLAIEWGTCLTPQNYEKDKLLVTLRLSGVTLRKLLGISWKCYAILYT